MIEQTINNAFLNTIVLAPHPDDELPLGRGEHNTLSELVTVSDGDQSTIDHVGGGFVESGKRTEEVRRAATILGFDSLFLAGLPDGDLAKHIDDIALIVIDRLEDDELPKIGAVKTYGENGFDLHPDHIAVHQAAVLAAKETGVKVFALLNKQEAQVERAVDHITVTKPATMMSAVEQHRSQIHVSSGWIEAVKNPGIKQQDIVPNYLDDYLTFNNGLFLHNWRDVTPTKTARRIISLA